MDDEVLLSEENLANWIKNIRFFFKYQSHRSALTEQPNNPLMDHNVRIHVEAQKYLFVHRDFQ